MALAKYIRCSTLQQDVNVQKDDIERYINYTFKDKPTIIEYVDFAMSGKTLQRPELERLKTDIISGKITAVVFQKLDRLSRTLQDLLEMFTLFERQNVTVHIVRDKIDTSTPQGKFFFHLIGAFVEFERATIAERLQNGRKYALKHGSKSGKPPHRPKKEINIRECVDLRKKGMSYNKLGKLYNIHPATVRSRLQERGIE